MTFKPLGHKVDVAQLEAHLEKILPETLEFLRAMVEINSFTRNREGVRQVARVTAKGFESLGFSAEFIPAADPELGDHLVLTREGRTARTIGCVSHLDTVFPPEEEIENDFRWRELPVGNETRIYGPGTIDIKGGTATMYMLLSALQACAPDVYEDTTWVLLLNAAEEELVMDFGDLARQRLPQQNTLACLVFEGGFANGDGYHIVTARKGMARYALSVYGRASHAGAAHDKGANAVVQLAEITQKIAEFTNYKRGLTFNVGVFHGGTVVNRVPHEAHASVEFRTFELDVYQEALEGMQMFDGYSTVKSPFDEYPCTTEVTLLHKQEPWPSNRATEYLFSIWQAAAEQLDGTVEREHRGGLSDGNQTWYHVPTLDGLGPLGGNSHASEQSDDGSKEQEYAVKESFVPKSLLNCLAVLRLLGAGV